MSGHSHWASIKHKKAETDAKRGKLFSKLIKHVMSAARVGGADPAQNITLRECIDRAKDASVPVDTIDRAIKKATSDAAGPAIETSAYEGYGPGGVAILVDLLTDNKNRTVGELRRIFEDRGAKTAQAGSVSWMFERKGLVTVKKEAIPEDALLELLLEAGVDDYATTGSLYEIVCDPKQLQGLKKSLAARKVTPEFADITRIPNSTVEVDAEKFGKIEALVETLSDHDDVDNVYTNAAGPAAG